VLEKGVEVFRGVSFVALVCVIAVVVPAVAFGAAPAAGVVVYAGPNLQAPPPNTPKQADALFFFPKVVTVHVGDTVTWQFRGLHTATFPGAKRPYPSIAPVGGKEPAVKDAAGQPFWWGGAAPLLGISPLTILLQGASTISSPSEVRSSGVLRVLTAGPKKPPAPYLLTFTKAGTYRYQCAIHPGMRGVVRVLPSTATVPTPAAQEQQGVVELRHAIADVRRLNRQRPTAASTVLVGAGHTATGGEVTSFFPGRLAVKVGTTVTFRNADQTDIHTVTFGPEKLRTRIENNFVAPHGHLILLEPLGVFASEPPRSGIVQYDGANHGNGYLNSGILNPRGSPAKAGPQTFRVTFTKAGTYHYECVVHQNMDGTIVVH
jgi:plastocyanin